MDERKSSENVAEEAPQETAQEHKEKDAVAVAAESVEKPAEETDENVNLADIVEDQKYAEETARGLYGAQDITVCTWPEGYKPRQPVLWCKTCTPETKAGVCLGCSLNCHDGHDLLELYTKRKFRCDCGNEKFGGRKCSFYEDKSSSNEFNQYSDNFAGKFCVCKDTYPSQNTDETMIQCCMCEDWFHLSHLKADVSSDKWKAVYDGVNPLICTDCVQKFPFMTVFESTEGAKCLSQFVLSENDTKEALSLVPEWRSLICKCDKCKDIVEVAGCSFLLDEEDDIEKYEEENNKKAKNEEATDAEVVNQLVNIAGRDVAVEVIRGYNELKQNLGAFLNQKAEAGAVITAEDVNSFFDGIKRRRLNPEE